MIQTRALAHILLEEVHHLLDRLDGLFGAVVVFEDVLQSLLEVFQFLLYFLLALLLGQTCLLRSLIHGGASLLDVHLWDACKRLWVQLGLSREFKRVLASLGLLERDLGIESLGAVGQHGVEVCFVALVHHRLLARTLI